MARCNLESCQRWRPDALTAHVGLTFDGRWYCSPVCLERVVRLRLIDAGQPRPYAYITPPIKIGALLIGQGAITKPEVDQALSMQQASGLRLGAQLRSLGRASAQQILKGLAAQARVRYLTAVNLGLVRQGPGALSRDTIRALGVVPFEVDDRRHLLKVACIAPVPRLSLSALRAVTGWDAGPFLVSDEQWPELLDSYGVTRTEDNPGPHSGFVTSIEDAAARVVLAAVEGRATRMIHTVGDPWLWVRLEGQQTTEDLVLVASATDLYSAHAVRFERPA